MRTLELPPRPRAVTVLVDTPGWFDPFAEELVERARADGDDARLSRRAEDIVEGGIAFLLSCLRLVPPAILARSALNLVVHASDLPRGRGFSPLVWQVLEGRNEVPVTMIEAVEAADAGDIVMQSRLVLAGHELNREMRNALGREIVRLCLALLDSDRVTLTPQAGEPSWYPRRRAEDSRLDPDRSIAAQFDLLRTVDNDRYPAFFDHRGHRYRLRIERDD